MKKITIFFGAIFAITLLFGCTRQPITSQNRIDKLNVIKSSDKSMEVYLEKEFDSNVQRFIRQSVVIENLQTGSKTVLNEVKVTPEEALTRYTEDGCNADKSDCCNSKINFNEFEPIKWSDNKTVEVNQYFDNYECAGQVTYVSIYDTAGKEIDKWTYNVAGEKSKSMFGESIK